MNKETFQILFAAVGLLYPDVQITAKIPLAQAVIESANFTANVYQLNNNCFGMKAPSVRETTATNKNGSGYANYESVLDCLRDYYEFCRYYKIKSDGDLLNLIATPGRYAADKQYGVKVNGAIVAMTKAGEYLSPALIKAGLAAVGIGAAYGTAELISQLLKN